MNYDELYYINIKLNDWDSELARVNRTFTPPIDIFENDEGLNIQLELPSFTKEEISVCCENNRLKIYGNKNEQKKEQNYLLMERYSGSFEKIIELPTSFDVTRVKAKLKDGVLSILIPF
ncbi:MAG: Hsp20/alpha crystallin family protein [Proteobacteria bacterium]|nr:Hsp20/alpha crystallin family protein [Pseudomonadota bacterium]